MKRLFIFFLLSVLYICLKAQCSEKIVPFVLYNPVRFSAEIEEAFISKQQYIKVEASSSDTTYFICLDELKNREETVSKEYLKNKGVNIAILNTSDSIFFLCATPYSFYNSRLEIYGKKENGKYFFRKPNMIDNYQSLENFIKQKYASAEVFRYYYLKNQEDYLTYRWDSNGLLDADPTKAYNFFKEDFAMYGIYNPKDTIGSINLFVKLISKFTQITPEQKSLLSTKLFDEIKNTGSTLSDIDFFFNFNQNGKLIKGVNLNTILLTVLTPVQTAKIITDLKIHSSKRRFYYENMRKMYPAYERKVDAYLNFSSESLKELSNLIFEPNKWNPNEKVDSTFQNQKYLNMMRLKYRKPAQFEEIYIRRNLAPQLLYGDLVSDDKDLIIKILAPHSIFELKDAEGLKSIQNEYLLEINTQLKRIHNVKNPDIEKYTILYPPQRTKKLYNADKIIMYDDTNYSIEGKKQFVRVIYVIKNGQGYFSIYCIIDYDKRENVDNYLQQIEGILTFE
jgi:hypothetical protein